MKNKLKRCNFKHLQCCGGHEVLKEKIPNGGRKQKMRKETVDYRQEKNALHPIQRVKEF